MQNSSHALHDRADLSEGVPSRWQIAYELFMGTLAVITVATLFSDSMWASAVNWVIWAVFLVDVGVRFAAASDRRAFPGRNWPDLVALIPFEVFRPFRTIRLLRLVRLFRAFRLFERVGDPVRGVLRQNGLQYVLGFVLALILLGGAAAWAIEERIATFGDGVWWALVTTTTVGYGDISPEDTGGRVIATILMVAGIGTLGMITGSIATYFTGMGGASEALPADVRYVQERLGEWPELSAAERERLVRLLEHVATES
jgi:voltage-gated potassium channel